MNLTLFDAIRRGLTIILAAGGLAGPVAVIVYTSSRAAASDVNDLKAKHSVLQQAHDDLVSSVARDRAEMVRRLDKMDEKQDHMIELLEAPFRSHGRR